MASQEVLTALETLHREIEKLQPAIKHIEMAMQVTQTVKEIPQKHVELLKLVKDSDIQHKKELQDVFSKELNLLTTEFRNLGKVTEEIQQQAKYEQKYLAELREKTVALYQGIERINFPERLDKLDANVAGIMAAVQSVQSRLDLIERNISDRLRDLQTQQSEGLKFIENNFDQLVLNLKLHFDRYSKKQTKFNIITWSLIVIVGFTIILKLFKLV